MPGPLEPGVSVAGDLDLVALDLQVVAEAERQVLVVFDEDLGITWLRFPDL